MMHCEPFFAILEAYSRDRQAGRDMAAKRLAELDGPLARVGERLVDILVGHGLLSVRELSPEVRHAMAERHSLRAILKV